MNIVYTDDETFEKKISRMSIAELERALQSLNGYLKTYRMSTVHCSPDVYEKNVRPHIARYELRIAQAETLLRTRS